MKLLMHRDAQASILRLTAVALGVAALLTLVPYWAPLLFAAWFAALTAPLRRKLRFLGGRHRIAAGLTVALMLAVIVPLLGLGLSLGSSAIQLVDQIAQSEGGRDTLAAIVSGGSEPTAGTLDIDLDQAVAIVRQYGGQAWKVLTAVAGAASKAALGLFIFAAGVYTFIADGERAYGWIESHLPVEPKYTRRFANASVKVGRGLLISVGLTALTQGTIATIAYFALGIPRALALGVLTCFASLVPAIGSTLVWLPVAAGLAITGRPVAAVVMIGIGALVIGSIDNVLRPYLSRFGQLEMPMFLVMIAMFGGFAMFGAAGIALGPLLVQLGMEALEISSEKNLFGKAEPVTEDKAPSD